MEADVQQAWVTANEAVGQARTEINQLGDEKDQELGMMQQNCRDQIVQLGRECELAMTELSERKADEMRTLEESCRLKSERVHQELQIVVDHAQRKVALLENDCREHVSSEQKVFEARLSQVSEERDSLKKELADVERRKASDKHRTRTLTSYRTPSRARSEEERTHNRPLTPLSSSHKSNLRLMKDTTTLNSKPPPNTENCTDGSRLSGEARGNKPKRRSRRSGSSTRPFVLLPSPSSGRCHFNADSNPF
jgi:hypothetical protein